MSIFYYDNGATLIVEPLTSIMKHCFLVDHANFYDTKQRVGFLVTSNYMYASSVRVYVERSRSETIDLRK